MKSKFDVKRGIAKITPENLDDVYLLKDVITPGSVLKAKTLRTKEIRRDEEIIKGKREWVVLAIQVEKISFSGNELRVTGKIIEGPEDVERGYHTIEIKPGTFFMLQKEWKSWEVEKIKSAKKKHERVLVCILDETEADVFLMNERIKPIAEFRCSLGKGSGTSTKLQYFANILNSMRRYEDIKYFFVAGPGFAKHELMKYLKEKDRKVAKKIVIDSVSQTGESGMQELLKRRVLEKVVKLSRVSEETAMVEMLLERIAKDELAFYGRKEAEELLSTGAVETLLVSDKKVREFENLVEKAEKTKAKVIIISSEHQAGEKLLGLGGIAGFLRYRFE